MAFRSILSKTLISSLRRTALRPLSSAVASTANTSAVFGSSTGHSFSTRPTWCYLNDPSPNYSNTHPEETILLDGCDFEHWLVVLEKPDDNMRRDDIIDSYIKTLAKVIGSEEEARMKIYSVSTKHYFAFGALVSEELSNKIKELPGVIYVLPDSYLDEENRDYGGEPFINGQAVPYDPKYHEVWVRNNAKANERNRINDRPWQNMQSRDGMGMQNSSDPGALIKDIILFLGLSLFIVSQLAIEQAKMRHAKLKNYQDIHPTGKNHVSQQIKAKRHRIRMH